MSREFRLKKCPVPFIVFSFVLAGTAALGGRVGGGATTHFDDVIRLEFVILDDETSLPVKGAAVRVIDPFGNESDDGEELVMVSDDRGKVALSRDFDLGELANEPKHDDRIRVFGWRVKVTAKGYQTSTTPLFEHTGEAMDERDPTVKQPNIRLRRKNNPKLGPGPQCGTFVCRDFGVRISLVISGDKFDALLSCPKQCSEHTPWFEAKYGDVKRVDGVLQLSVRRQELIRRNGGDKYEWLKNTFVPVRWAKRQYLIASDQGIAFCNAINQGEEPTASEGEFALAEGHEEIAVDGAPDVPEQWTHYLLKDEVRGDVTELLPDSLAKVNAGRKDGLRVGMELLPIAENLQL